MGAAAPSAAPASSGAAQTRHLPSLKRRQAADLTHFSAARLRPQTLFPASFPSRLRQGGAWQLGWRACDGVRVMACVRWRACDGVRGHWELEAAQA